MKYKHLGYAVTLKIIHASDDLRVTDKQIITFCLDSIDAESVFDAFNGKNLFYYGTDYETIEEIILALEEWEFSDDSRDFSKKELKTRLLR